MLKLSIVFLLCAIVRVKAPISIDMTPIELQSIGEVLVESYFHHNLIQRVRTTRSIVFTCIRIGGSFFFQYTGITASLVCAGVLAPIAQQHYNSYVKSKHHHSKSTPSKMCEHDFGCDRNVCWRTCHTEKKSETLSWCYSTPDKSVRKYQQCEYAHDCSGCWECLGPCNA